MNTRGRSFSTVLPYAIDTGTDDPHKNTFFANKILKRVSRMSKLMGKAPLVRSITERNDNEVEEKLHKQFLYFRKEFIDVANSSGTTVPLDMVEDTSGRLFNFVQQSVPLYILQILATETENIHLLRVSLSLLIITVVLLRKKLPVDDPEVTHSDWNTVLAEMRANWAALSLHQIADGGAVSVCINLLVNTVVQGIHELSLNLLAHLVAISEEAASQMLQPPTYKYESSTKEEEKPQKKSASMGASVKFRPETPNKLQSDSVSSRSEAMGATKKPPTPKSASKSSKSKAQKEVVSESGSKTPLPVPFGMRDLRQLSSKGLLAGGADRRDSSEELSKEDNSKKNSCLSYLLSVAALYPNRLMVLSSTAEVLTAIASAKDHVEEFSTLAAQAPTCLLPMLNSIDNQGDKKGGKGKGQVEVNHHHQLHRLSSYGVVGWAGIKLLLKFLLRIAKYERHKDGSLDWNSVASSHSNELQLEHSHANVLIAACFMASHSPKVASYLLDVPGAIDLISLSCKLHKDTEVIVKAARSYEHAIARARERRAAELEAQREREAQRTSSAVTRRGPISERPFTPTPHSINRSRSPSPSPSSVLPKFKSSKHSPPRTSKLILNPNPASISLGQSSTTSLSVETESPIPEKEKASESTTNSPPKASASGKALWGKLKKVSAMTSGKFKPPSPGKEVLVPMTTTDSVTSESSSVSITTTQADSEPQAAPPPPVQTRKKSVDLKGETAVHGRSDAHNSGRVHRGEEQHRETYQPKQHIDTQTQNLNLMRAKSAVSPTFPGATNMRDDFRHDRNSNTSTSLSALPTVHGFGAGVRPMSSSGQQLPRIFKVMPTMPTLPSRIEAETVISGEYFGTKQVWQQQMQDLDVPDKNIEPAAYFDMMAKQEMHKVGTRLGLQANGRLLPGPVRIQRVYGSCGVPYNPNIRPASSPSQLGTSIGGSRDLKYTGVIGGRVGVKEASVYEGEEDEYEAIDIATDMEPLYSANIMGPQIEEMEDFPLVDDLIGQSDAASEGTDRMIQQAAQSNLPLMANEIEKKSRKELASASNVRKQMRLQFKAEQDVLAADQRRKSQGLARKQREPVLPDPFDSVAVEVIMT